MMSQENQLQLPEHRRYKQPSEVRGQSRQTTDGANTSAADRNSLAALYVLLIICTWQRVLSRASRHVSCRHLASSWLGPSGRPRPTNQTHHSSVQRTASGKKRVLKRCEFTFLLAENIFNSFIQRWDITTGPELLGAFRVQTCVAAVVNFTPARRLTLPSKTFLWGQSSRRLQGQRRPCWRRGTTLHQVLQHC